MGGARQCVKGEGPGQCRDVWCVGLWCVQHTWDKWVEPVMSRVPVVERQPLPMGYVMAGWWLSTSVTLLPRDETM